MITNHKLLIPLQPLFLIVRILLLLSNSYTIHFPIFTLVSQLHLFTCSHSFVFAHACSHCFPSFMFVFVHTRSCSLLVHTCSCSLMFVTRSHSCMFVHVRYLFILVRVRSCSLVFAHVRSQWLVLVCLSFTQFAIHSYLLYTITNPS